MLGYFLEHEHMSGKFRHETGADQVAQNGDVECSGRFGAVDRRLECIGRAIEQERQGACNGGVSAISSDVVRDRPVHGVKAVTMEPTQKKRTIAIAEIELSPR